MKKKRNEDQKMTKTNIEDISYITSEYCYRLHYHEKIKSHFTEKQKKEIGKRISELTLRSPIWLERDTNYANDFPEIKSYITVPLTGMFLCAILRGIVEDLQGVTKILPIK